MGLEDYNERQRGHYKWMCEAHPKVAKVYLERFNPVIDAGKEHTIMEEIMSEILDEAVRTKPLNEKMGSAA